MNKRSFLKSAGLIGIASIINPKNLFASTSNVGTWPNSAVDEMPKNGEFSLPSLKHAYDAYEPSIDRMTMEIHHSKHHAGYVKKLNAAIKDTEMASMSLDQIIKQVKPGQTAVRNNGGGHYNHSFFWNLLNPSKTNPGGNLLAAINNSFGSVEKMQEEFNKAAGDRFGSGWAWLCKNKKGQLVITSTPNQDNPLMSQIAKSKAWPVIGLDVWEHAYYLKYQNKRADYVKAFWNLVDWNVAEQNFNKG